jgi:hypothetical protein
VLTVTQRRYIQLFADVYRFRGLVPNMDPLLLDSLALYSTAPTPDELRGCVFFRLRNAFGATMGHVVENAREKREKGERV